MIGMPSHPLFPEQMDTLNGASFRNLLLASPGGEAVSHDGSSEPAGLTDEGWRWLKVLDFPVEWRKLKQMPFIWVHSLTNLSPPLISLFCQSVPKCRLTKNPASPRGKPRGSSRELTPFNIPLSSIRQRVAKLATPTSSEVFDAFHRPAKKESHQTLPLADSL